MKACNERWNDCLIDWVFSALGETERHEVESHVETCGACRIAVRTLQKQRDTIDGSVGELVRCEPSPRFRARLLAEVASSSHTPGARWAWVALATALAAAVAVVLLQDGSNLDPDEELRTPRESAALITNWRPPTDSLTRMPEPAGLAAPLRFGEFYFAFPRAPANEEEDSDETERDG